jgi:DNA-binding transcriptional LysR family regulator
MELKWLEDFVSVAKLPNFSHAARARYATQPALSRRVKALEHWYGVALLDRSTYPVTLTEAGRDLFCRSPSRSLRTSIAAGAKRVPRLAPPVGRFDSPCLIRSPGRYFQADGASNRGIAS